MSLHFWYEMRYRCSRCGSTVQMALEDGCEGPPGGREAEITLPPPLSGKGVLRFTPSGRAVQPVPFTFKCPCEPRAYKSHVDWPADAGIDVTVPDGEEPGFPHFRYDASENPQACGQPRGVL